MCEKHFNKSVMLPQYSILEMKDDKLVKSLI